jgi:molybdopterin-synthase adenylyltransferase
LTYSEEHRYHRQLGLVDQTAVSSMKISLGGDPQLIMATLTQLACAGVGTGPKGSISICIPQKNKLGNNRHSWVFATSDKLETWDDLTVILKESHNINLNFSSPTKSTHVEFLRGDNFDDDADLYATIWHGQAVLSKSPLKFNTPPNVSPSMLDASLEVALAAATVQRLFAINGVIKENMLSDTWVTLTGRVDGLMPDEAVKEYSSIHGGATATLLPDGSGSLLRFRIPLESTPSELLKGIIHSCKMPEMLSNDWLMEVGPFPLKLNEQGEVISSKLELPRQIDSANLLVLGTGGLGSWATPLFVSGVNLENLNISLVDADSSVDIHNLNRQVLYTIKEVGIPKAPAAAKRLREIFGERPNITAIQNRLEQRHATPAIAVEILGDYGSISLDELVGIEDVIDDEPLNEAIENMDIALACLDNQFARTMLNKCCISNEVPMINGGGEAFSGVVEVLENGTCMTCRYGKDAAYTQEIISCQETGTRPVASIVTTTAWVGAMQAALALLNLAGIKGHREGMSWDNGIVHDRPVGGLPWIKGECSCHI